MQKAHDALAEFVTDDPREATKLAWALTVSRNPSRAASLAKTVEAYSILGFYYAESKAHKRAAAAGEKQRWQRIEDILEAAVKATSSGIIAMQHENNHTERHVGQG